MTNSAVADKALPLSPFPPPPARTPRTTSTKPNSALTRLNKPNEITPSPKGKTTNENPAEPSAPYEVDPWLLAQNNSSSPTTNTSPWITLGHKKTRTC